MDKIIDEFAPVIMDGLPDVKKKKVPPEILRFLIGKRYADQRGISWTISEAEYVELICQKCHYCHGRFLGRGCGLSLEGQRPWL